MSAVDASPAAGAPPDPAAYWTKLLSDPAFRAMPPDQRAAMLTKHVQEARQSQQGGSDMALGQTIGAVPKAKSVHEPAEPEGHPLDATLADPNADHMGALHAYVYGP